MEVSILFNKIQCNYYKLFIFFGNNRNINTYKGRRNKEEQQEMKNNSVDIFQINKLKRISF